MMTRKEFEKFRVEIEAKKFLSVEMNPISYGIQRLAFEKEKLKTLIAAAESIPMKTTIAKANRWKRKLKRADLSMVRLQKADIHPVTMPLKTFERQSLPILRTSAPLPVAVSRGNLLAASAKLRARQ